MSPHTLRTLRAKIPGVLETCLLEAKSRALHFLLCWSYSFPCGRIEGQGVRWHTVAWSCYVALFAEDLCNVYPSVYTQSKNKKFHVVDQIFLVKRGGPYTSPTTRLIKHGKNSWNSTGMELLLKSGFQKIVEIPKARNEFSLPTSKSETSK